MRCSCVIYSITDSTATNKLLYLLTYLAHGHPETATIMLRFRTRQLFHFIDQLCDLLQLTYLITIFCYLILFITLFILFFFVNKGPLWWWYKKNDESEELSIKLFVICCTRLIIGEGKLLYGHQVIQRGGVDKRGGCRWLIILGTKWLAERVIHQEIPQYI